MRACFVVWAAGEFGYPNLLPFEGADLCIHNSRVDSWRELKGEKFLVIGGSESGVDAAYHLVQNGKREAGNLLLQYGFSRQRPSEGESGATTCNLKLLPNAHISFWGFGLFYGEIGQGGVFIGRFNFG